MTLQCNQCRVCIGRDDTDCDASTHHTDGGACMPLVYSDVFETDEEYEARMRQFYLEGKC